MTRLPETRREQLAYAANGPSGGTAQVMLLLRAEGLHSCPQVMWTMYRKTVSQIVGADDRLILFCGISVGFENEEVPRLRTGRAEMAETVNFIGC